MVRDDHWHGRRVLITGGAGAIGSNLVRALLDVGALPVVLDDFSASEPVNLPSDSRVESIRGDIATDGALQQAFGLRPTVVFHLAALFANQNSVDHPRADLRVNGLGTLMLLEAAVAAGRPRVVFASSGCSIYGIDAELPLREGVASLHMSTPYQITKMLGEAYGNYFHAQQGLPVAHARLFNVYGPGDAPGPYRSVIPNFIDRALDGLPLRVTGSGSDTRDFTFAADAVDGLMRIGSHPGAPGRAFNIASAREVSVLELARLVNRLTRNTAGVEFVPQRGWDTRRRLLASVDRARTELGYEPATTLRAGLEKTIAWARQRRVASTFAAVPPSARDAEAPARAWALDHSAR